MTATSRIRHALALFNHLTDLRQMGQLTATEETVLFEALTTLISNLHQPTLPPAIVLSGPFLKTYVLRHAEATPTRLLVQQPGFPERRLPHVPIFDWGFDERGTGASDTALAILADHFGETLSRQRFIAGRSSFCQTYQALATHLPALLKQGQLPASRLAQFLHQQQRADSKRFARTSHGGGTLQERTSPHARSTPQGR